MFTVRTPRTPRPHRASAAKVKSKTIQCGVKRFRAVLRPTLRRLRAELEYARSIPEGVRGLNYTKHNKTDRGCLWYSAVNLPLISPYCVLIVLSLMDCMSCTGPRRVPDQSNVFGCPASCLEKGLKPVLLLAHGQCFWYSLLLWNQPEIFLEHFDTILSSRCLVYIYVYTTMECSSYCGSNHQFILQDLTKDNVTTTLVTL